MVLILSDSLKMHGLKMMIIFDFDKSKVYKCEAEATDSEPPLITFEFNSPRGALHRTDSA